MRCTGQTVHSPLPHRPSPDRMQIFILISGRRANRFGLRCSQVSLKNFSYSTQHLTIIFYVSPKNLKVKRTENFQVFNNFYFIGVIFSSALHLKFDQKYLCEQVN